jgi:hypothetical protein
MNNFCEECGNKLNHGDLFCQECGTKVPAPATPVSADGKQKDNLFFDFFSSKNHNIKPEHSALKWGIAITNFNQLEKLIGTEGVQQLKAALETYFDFWQKRGFGYLLLDVSNNRIKNLKNDNWKHHVNLLRKAVKQVKAKLKNEAIANYIIGGDNIIPMPVFTNPVPDNDDVDVDSDLPYSSLSVKDPLVKEEARTPLLSVGRIPTGNNTSAIEIINVLNNTMLAAENFPTHSKFGMCALPWENVSSDINNRIGIGSISVSPEVTADNLHHHYHANYNIHYFNLHGSNESSAWFGQIKKEFPPAFFPDAIAHNQQLNVIGVEACYGARFIELNREDSVLLSAMATKTISFVGSSRIAYGPPASPMDLADIVIHDYLNYLQQGIPAGIAHAKARVRGFTNSKNSSPATALLTLLEFNLYGDPMFFISNGGAKSYESKSLETADMSFNADALGELAENELQISKSHTDSSGSLYQQMRELVDAKQRDIIKTLNTNVWERYPTFKDIEPKFIKYAFEGKNFNQLTYSKKFEKLNLHLLVNTSDNGDIICEFESK